MLDADALDLPPLVLGGAPALDVAPWHAARPHELASALSEADAAAPHLADLARRWLPWMPRKPLASQNIRSICRTPSSGPLLLADAVTCPWMAPNTAEGINALCVDVDHDDALEHRADLVAAGSPVPDLMIDPWSGRAHAVLWLASPVPTYEGAREKPQAAASYAGRLLAAAMGGTLMPQRGLVKSPWGRISAMTGERLRRGPRPSVPARWDTYEAATAAGADLMWITIPGTGPAELRAIVGALAPRFEFDAEPSAPPARRRRNRGIPSALGRNCELFDLVRWWAYDHGESDAGAILAEAERINASGLFATPLPASEVAALARSIARFMASRYRPRTGTGQGRGRDRLAGADLSTAARRAVAGATTAAVRAAATDTRIAAAVAALLAAGRPLTQAAIAAAAGVGLNTVARRWTRPANPPNAALSDSAAVAAPRGPAPAPQDSEKESLRALALRDRRSRSLLAVLAAAGSADVLPTISADLAALPAVAAALAEAVERRTRLLLASLSAVAEAARRPGADPGELPAVPADLAHLPEVRRALRVAEAARADARRRAGARAAKVATAARREGYVALLRAGRAEAWRQWREESDALDQVWDHREREADSRELAGIRARRQAAFGARWLAWDAALRIVGGQPPRRRRRAVEVPADAIPW